MKTNDLLGPALDWAVAKSAGFDASVANSGLVVIRRANVVDYFDPSTNWGWAGPIIEREQISVKVDGPMHDHIEWWAEMQPDYSKPLRHTAWGPTPLVAAMRCYVVAQCGLDVDVPKGLLP